MLSGICDIRNRDNVALCFLCCTTTLISGKTIVKVTLFFVEHTEHNTVIQIVLIAKLTKSALKSIKYFLYLIKITMTTRDIYFVLCTHCVHLCVKTSVVILKTHSKTF